MNFGAEALAAGQSAARAIGHDPTLTDRDEFIFLLHTAAEIEHSLMVQYLYAWFSLRPPSDFPDADKKAKLQAWDAALREIAVEEMGHLITVQNLLRSVGGPLNFDREDMPFRSGLYPFRFQLEPLSKNSLAKYVFAEMPTGLENEPQYAEVVKRARATADGDADLNHVGVLFARLEELATSLPAQTFQPSSAKFQANATEWGRGYEEAEPGSGNGMIVRVIKSRQQAISAIRDIAEQGEGMSAPANDATMHKSHFQRFFEIYDAFPENGDWRPTRNVPTDPNTSQAFNETDDAGEIEDSSFNAGRITFPKSRLFAQLFNQRYRMLLINLMHALSIASDEVSNDGGNLSTGRADVREWTFGEMRRLNVINQVLVTLPLQVETDDRKAGATFELPYTLTFPDESDNRWRLHNDLISDTKRLILSLRELELKPDEKSLLDQIQKDDELQDQKVQQYLRQTSDDVGLFGIRIFPPTSIARLGSATEPLDNFELELDGTGHRRIRGTETLVVDRMTGAITGVKVPDTISFKAGNQIRPVCPFLEVWAQFSEDGDFEPLTIQHLEELNATIKWRVRVANLKVWRRTGDPNDRIEADSGDISDHAVRELLGRSPNFKDGVDKVIPFGSVQAIRPTNAFPELRLRFTPAAGKVYGPKAGDPNVANDVYDATRGNWVGHRDGTPGTPLFTFPGGIFANDGNGVSLGYLDDTCDGIIEAIVKMEGREFIATTRVSSGPPDFAPDSLPVRSVFDDSEQILLGVQPTAQTNSIAAARELVRRALDTIRLMNTDALNTRGMPSHDARLGRRREPIFRPDARARYASVVGFHEAILGDLVRLETDNSPPARVAARSSLQAMLQRLREYDQIGNLSDGGRQQMPAMMRGSDGRYLAVTRRLIQHVRRAIELLEDSPVPPPSTAEQAMIDLIISKRFGAPRHSNISLPGGETLATLFMDPPRLLQYLRTATVFGNIVPGLNGQRLIKPQDIAASAFLKLVTNPSHPMFSRFDQANDIPIIERWIMSLPAES